uniref:5-hydroxytryptamine receptor 3A n=1 Tax=Latimeria chalumnae TaxID=7897 RepID=H3BAU5_LATCH
TNSYSMLLPISIGCSATLSYNYSEYTYIKFLETFQPIFDKPGMRPSTNWIWPTQVNVSLTIHEILGVNEKTHFLITFVWVQQLWFNEFLMWDPADFGGMERIALPVEFLWHPDFYVYEFMGEDLSPHVSYLYVNHNGMVTYVVPSKLVTSCHLDVFYFPFDTHTCTLTIGLYLSTVSDVIMGHHSTPQQLFLDSLEHIKDSGEWELTDFDGSLSSFLFQGIQSPEEWAMLIYTVKIRRRPTHYLVNLLIPSALLMLIEILSFFLPAHSTDRSSFKVTVLLGYIVFLLFVNDILPNNSGGTPLIGGYFLVCLALMIVDLLESILISRIIQRSSFGMVRVPSWLRLLVLHYLLKLLQYKDQKLNKDLWSIGMKTRQSFSILPNKCHHLEVNRQQGKGNLDTEVFQILSVIRKISQDVQTIKDHISTSKKKKKMDKEWFKVALILDIFLFRIYIAFIIICVLSLSALWSQ